MSKTSLVPYRVPALDVSGLTGTVAASRYVGATASGAPSTGAHVVGDWCIDQTGKIWICTVAATPGTFVQVGAGGGVTLATTVQTESGLDAGQVGTSTNVAREDHRHPITNLVDLSTTQSIGGQKTFNGSVVVTAGNQAQTAYSATPGLASQSYQNVTAATATNVVQTPGAMMQMGTYWSGVASLLWSTAISSTVDNVGGATRLILTAATTATSGDLFVPSGSRLTTGTRSVITGTRATTTNANDTVALGNFSTTGGAMELRIHAHLVAGSTNVTKVYEYAVNATTGYNTIASNIANVGTLVTVTVASTTGLTTGQVVTIENTTGITNVNGSWTITVTSSTQFTFTASVTPTGTYTALSGLVTVWYKCLPVDMSANQATSNDFALEARRFQNGTHEFRFRQITIGAAGTLTFIIETLGDSVAGFTTNSTVTASPGVPNTLHPSNPLVSAAGLVGIGTDAPGSLLHIVGAGGITIQGASGQQSLIAFQANGVSGASQSFVGQAGTAGVMLLDTLTEDFAVAAETGKTLRLGVVGSNSTLRVTATDAQVNDNGTARSLPRGRVGSSGGQNTSTGSITTTETAGGGLTNVTFTAVTGRKYRINYSYVVGSSIANDNMATRLRDGAGSAPTNASTILETTVVAASANAAASVRVSGFHEVDCVASGATAPGQINAGAHNIGAFVTRNGGTGTLFIGSATAGVLSEISIDDVTA